VFSIKDRKEDKYKEIDKKIIKDMFKSKKLYENEKMRIEINWNRVDIERYEIFVYGKEWNKGDIDEEMMKEIENDSIDFVKLMIENGVKMKKLIYINTMQEI
jgi:hypothetical protein